MIASQIETIVHSHEPDVEVSEIVQESYIPEKKQEANESYNNEDKKLTVRLATGAAIYAIGMALTVFAKVPLPIELAFLIVSYVILGGDVVWQAVRNISKGRVFDEHFLMSVSTIGAFVIGEYPEAVAVMLFYQVGEFFQSSKGTVKLERESNSSKKIIDAVEDLYLRIADRYTGIRRIEVCANRVAPESYVQYSLFDDPKQTDKERHLQEAVLNVKQRYGKNAIMRGSNLLECSTYRERNEQIGGHRA